MIYVYAASNTWMSTNQNHRTAPAMSPTHSQPQPATPSSHYFRRRFADVLLDPLLALLCVQVLGSALPTLMSCHERA